MWDYAALRALASVIRTGTFDKAARELHLTPSAVSQRIKGLEERMGRILVVRSVPVTPTPEGERLLRHMLQVSLLESELAGDPLLAGVETPAPARIPVALNADSLATWVLPALQAFHEATGGTLALQVDDQDHTREWLRNGTVMGAVTADPEPVSGCRVDALGEMPYVAACSADYASRWFPPGADVAQALQVVPMLVFNAKDRLQHRYARSLGVADDRLRAPSWIIPSAQAFIDATLAGLGWGLHPVLLVQQWLDRGEMVEVAPGHRLRVPMFWQSWRLESSTLQVLGREVRRAAADVLEPVGPATQAARVQSRRSP